MLISSRSSALKFSHIEEFAILVYYDGFAVLVKRYRPYYQRSRVGIRSTGTSSVPAKTSCPHRRQRRIVTQRTADSYCGSWYSRWISCVLWPHSGLPHEPRKFVQS